MSNTASKSPKSIARTNLESMARVILPDTLSEYVLGYFPEATNLQISHNQSTCFHYRNEGDNSIATSNNILISFNSVNFGICCGAQLLVDFHSEDPPFISEYFRRWCSLTQIPHFGIFVKVCGSDLYGNLSVDPKVWRWKYDYYEEFAKHGKLIKEWRNPLYANHLLCMYEFCNHEKYDSFLTGDLSPVQKRIVIE